MTDDKPMRFPDRRGRTRAVRVRDPQGHFELEDGVYRWKPEHPHAKSSRIFVSTKAMEVVSK